MLSGEGSKTPSWSRVLAHELAWGTIQSARLPTPWYRHNLIRLDAGPTVKVLSDLDFVDPAHHTRPHRQQLGCHLNSRFQVLGNSTFSCQSSHPILSDKITHSQDQWSLSNRSGFIADSSNSNHKKSRPTLCIIFSLNGLFSFLSQSNATSQQLTLLSRTSLDIPWLYALHLFRDHVSVLGIMRARNERNLWVRVPHLGFHVSHLTLAIPSKHGVR